MTTAEKASVESNVTLLPQGVNHRTLHGPHAEGDTRKERSQDFHCPHCGWNVHHAAMSHCAAALLAEGRSAVSRKGMLLACAAWWAYGVLTAALVAYAFSR